MRTLLLIQLLTLLWLETNVINGTGVYFIANEDVYISYDTWLVTFTIDLEPYEEHIQTLHDSICEFYYAFNEIAHHDNVTRNQNHLSNVHNDVQNFLRREMTQIDRSFDDVLSRYHEINTIVNQKVSTRSKRGLFPFGGKILNFLFSVPTESNLKKLRRTIVDVAKTQSQLVHVVENSISILNTSHEEIKENREMLNGIYNVTFELRNEMNLILNRLTQDIVPEITYLELLGRINNMYHVITSTLDKFKYTFDNILHQVQLCLQGNLPITLLPPSQITNIFSQVQNKLRHGYVLPYSVRSYDRLSYYKYLSPLVVPQKTKLHILIAIPIISQNQKLNVYESVKMPFTHQQFNLSAIYDTEADFIAISPDRKVYSLLHKSETTFCQQGYACKLSSPLYKSNNYPSCLLYLFSEINPRSTNIVIYDSLKVLFFLSPNTWTMENG